MQKLHNKDFQIAFKSGSDANKSKFAKECVHGELYLSDDALYVAESSAGANDSALSKFLPAFGDATIFSTEAALISSIAPAGTAAYANDTGRLYISNGPGWAYYNSFNNNYSVTHDGTDDYCGATINRLGGASWSTTTPVSQSAWVKSLSFATNDGVFGMGKGGSGGTYNPSFTGGNGGIHQQGGTATSGGYYLWLSATKYSLSGTFNTGDWHHIAWTWDGSNGVVYVDGTQNITFTDTSNGYNTVFNVYTGVVRWNTNFGECLVDDFATWDTALSASDVTKLYNGGSSKFDLSQLSPLAWYRMGDGTESGSGTVAYDASGNSQGNLTLFSGSTFSTDTP